MQYRTMGRNGPSVSVLGFGCGAIGGLLTKGDPSEQKRTVARALEAGITYFDTAQAYGNGRSEETIGPILRELKANVVLGTKFRLEQEQIPNAAAMIREHLEDEPQAARPGQRRPVQPATTGSASTSRATRARCRLRTCSGRSPRGWRRSARLA